MKEIIEDLKKEHFTRRECIVYGIIYPLVFVLLAIIAGAIE